MFLGSVLYPPNKYPGLRSVRGCDFYQEALNANATFPNGTINNASAAVFEEWGDGYIRNPFKGHRYHLFFFLTGRLVHLVLIFSSENHLHHLRCYQYLPHVVFSIHDVLRRSQHAARCFLPNLVSLYLSSATQQNRISQIVEPGSSCVCHYFRLRSNHFLSKSSREVGSVEGGVFFLSSLPSPAIFFFFLSFLLGSFFALYSQPHEPFALSKSHWQLRAGYPLMTRPGHRFR